ncbi:FMN-dependent NADH-azoreductase [Legionella oakridgensis]|uniref:FMN-dependent NADH-azoreductase n=1 Tax=Legionella oakridgensis TaxID=29423 RepID=UPI0003DE29B6|nr:NAD(P)H-dependent oxidoreductase [Legionella oakridgensis]ETO94436.1 acyl carrier protein phosphodiesterase [Legionella oakridgensis RV-2-2007]
MKTLAIDSSMMGQHSVSRQLMRYFIERDQSEIKYRNLVEENPAHLSLEFIEKNTIDNSMIDETTYQINLSKIYLNEFLEAERLVIAAPMYNFSIPSVLKAWIDRIMIAGKTFKYTEQGPIGLAGEKKVYIISTRGGEYEILPSLKAMDHQENYLVTVFNFLGIHDIRFIRAEGVNRGKDKKLAAINQAYQQIDKIVSMEWEYPGSFSNQGISDHSNLKSDSQKSCMSCC